MATAYRTIFRQVALRVNALVGTDSSTLETKYTGGTITSSDTDSVIFPYTSIKDAILIAEGELAGIIAGQTDHPYRSYLHGTTGNLADGAVIPTVDTGSTAIIGVPGAVRDTTDSIQLTAQPLSVIKNIKRNSGSFLTNDYYYYCIVGNRIRHTRTNVVMDVCVWDRDLATTGRAAVLDASVTTGTSGKNMALPDSLGSAVVAGAVSYLVRDDEFVNQSQIYRNYYQSVIGALQNGGVHVPSAPAAMTTTTSAG